MAFTERYITTGGSSGNTGTDDTSDAWDIITGWDLFDAGYRFNIKAGSYSVSAASLETNTGSGPVSSNPTHVRGYGSTIGDGYLGRDSEGKLITTNFPVVTLDSTYAIIGSIGNSYIFENIKFVGEYNGNFFTAASSSTFINCIFENASTGGSAVAVAAGASNTYVGCEIYLTGASGGLRAITCGNNCRFYGCRVSGKNVLAIRGASSTTGTLVAVGCTIFDSTIGIELNPTAGTTTSFISDCTFYNCSTCAIQSPSTAYTGNYSIINCHATDCGRFINNGSATVVPFCKVGNRTRDNTNADTVQGNYPEVNYTTTDNGDATTDYIDAATNKNFRLKPTAVGRAAGQLTNRDIGGPQAPSAANSIIMG